MANLNAENGALQINDGLILRSRVTTTRPNIKGSRTPANKGGLPFRVGMGHPRKKQSLETRREER
jgi:hypothetical protein